MIVLIAVLGICLLAYAVRARRRPGPGSDQGVLPAGEARDAPERLLAAAVTLLAADRAEWGRAMVGELAGLTTRSARWRFVLGCARVAVFAPPGRDAHGRTIVAGVAAAVAASVGLVGYGLVRYPGVVTGAATWVELAVFLAVLGGYLTTASRVVHRLSLPSLRPVRVALLAGVLVATLWVVVGVFASFGTQQYVNMLLLLTVPVGSLAVGAAGTWRGRAARTGRQAVFLWAVGAGLVVFLGWVGMTLLTAGGPYDAGLVRDFHTSGAPDLATYAVSDNMGAGMALLLLIPIKAVLFGLLGSVVAARLLPVAPQPPPPADPATT
ncbi:MAG TPA: hypothetical protein VLJ59_03910 [Mycobacteriales bacterium]|nr:hypothetical protein [Mycobacteriales bacterium]